MGKRSALMRFGAGAVFAAVSASALVIAGSAQSAPAPKVQRVAATATEAPATLAPVATDTPAPTDLATAEPTTTAQPTPPPVVAHTPTPAPAVPAVQQPFDLVDNGGFEQVNNCDAMNGCDPLIWKVGSVLHNPAFAPSFKPISDGGFEGTHKARLDVGDNGYNRQQLSQKVEIPADASLVTLGFVSDTKRSGVSAVGQVSITDAAGATTPVVTLTQAEAASSPMESNWVRHTVDVSAYRGQTVTLTVSAQLTGPYVDFANAMFSFDELSIMSQ